MNRHLINQKHKDSWMLYNKVNAMPVSCKNLHILSTGFFERKIKSVEFFF